MIIPRGAKVVIIDDVMDETLPLIKALSQENVPFIYYTGLDKDELPAHPLQNIRLVFLDLELGSKGLSQKNQRSKAIGILKSIIGKNNGPYVVVIWSKHDELIDGIEEALGKKGIPPLCILNLEKSSFIKNGEFSTDSFKDIRAAIERKIQELGVYRLFLLWENLTSSAAGKIIEQFSSFYPVDDDWNNNMAAIFQKLASAYGGKTLNQTDAFDIMKNSLSTFNQAYLDTIESEIREFQNSQDIPSFASSGTLDDRIIADINSRLHLVLKDRGDAEPGSVYEINRNASEKLNLDEICDPSFVKKRSEFNAFAKRITYIYLEVSALCDFAQQKQRMNRFLSGIVYPINFEKNVKGGGFVYKSPILQVKKEPCQIALDLRFLVSTPLGKMNNSVKLFKIRPELLREVQSRLVWHINRPGTVFLIPK